ncbi:hypothetical protein [Streptomyces nodosus]|uniref:Uncharacterized protein n=1 Tax=Streptomyces nodosus TaxID=40318 RepID=A0A0B5DI38_9ACTN|nr:hypothetical protein [Streptomyces nodosus]AJE43368.1 hypothetical protein SNOD_27555 [Streptomyces nodosus]MBB4794804.1 ABC-2 type transport system permease protein [Streptomyces nodosus]QEV41864.1 hypothetical protein CP978_27835 [Streptomyces nodosus]
MRELSVWRVEWLRLLRTRRLIALLGVFVLFGFTGPLLARYTPQLLKHAGNHGQQVTIIVPPPVPADGISQYVSSALQIGLIVTVVVAAYACSVDAKPALSVFYRSRTARYRDLLVPRLVVSAVAAVGGYLAGLLAAWYETAVLLGNPDTVAMGQTALVGAVYLVFAVAVTALAGTLARTTLGTVGYALLVLFGLPLLGALPQVSHWLPTMLSGMPDQFLRHTATDHAQRALATAAVLILGSVAAAVLRGARREA